MPVHSLASATQNISGNKLIAGVAVFAAAGLVRLRARGRVSTWERDWAGKMILIIGSPTPTVLRLIDHLLHLPSPPQILYLPPYPSPLPDSLLTVLHTIRISLTNPLAQLHCEPLPQTPAGVREFTAKWGRTSTGMTGEGGRRIDAIVLGSGWEVIADIPLPASDTASSSSSPSSSSTSTSSKASTTSPKKKKANNDGKPRQWTIHEYYFHLLSSLLPNLIRQPPERNIRIISLISPTYSSALPTLLGKPPKKDSVVQVTGAKSITFIFLMAQFQLIFDTLAAAALKKVKEVPSADGIVKKKDGDVKSNVMVLRVIMPWTRDEVVRGAIGIDASWWKWLLWIILYPFIVFFTPSPGQSIQSILFALHAPVRYGPLQETPQVNQASGLNEKESKDTSGDSKTAADDPRTSAVGNGDVVRNCSVIDLPPVLQDPNLAKITFDALEKDVETAVKAEAAQEKAAKSTSTSAGTEKEKTS